MFQSFKIVLNLSYESLLTLWYISYFIWIPLRFKLKTNENESEEIVNFFISHTILV